MNTTISLTARETRRLEDAVETLTEYSRIFTAIRQDGTARDNAAQAINLIKEILSEQPTKDRPTYKHHLVIIQGETVDEWAIFESSDYFTALMVAENITPPYSSYVELFGTDEDPDTYLTGKTLYRKGEKR